MRRSLAVSLSLAVLVTSIGLAPYQAVAAETAAPGKAWAPVIETALPVLQASGAPETLAVENALGELRFDLALKREDGAQLLAQFLPGPYAGHPEALARLEPGPRAAAIAAALEAARTSLDTEAASLLERADRNALGEAATRRLQRLASASYLLSPGMAASVRAHAEQLRELKTKSALAQGLGALLGRRTDPAALAVRQQQAEQHQAVVSEIQGILAGAAALTSRLSESSPRGAFARSTLAPYAQRSLEQAAGRLAGRGFSADALHLAILQRHQTVFAQWAKPGWVQPLRRSGDWTPFVATLSAAAASAVSPFQAAAVAPLSAHPDFRMALPSWSLFAGPATVADLIAARFGPAREVPPAKLEVELFRFAGIPVGGSVNMLLLTAAAALFFAGGSLLGAAIFMVMLYGSVIAHEFGHALTAKYYGIQTPSITINPLGGMASLSREPQTAKEEFWITLNGPMVNLALAAASWALLHVASAAFLPLLTSLMTLNAALGVFNLVIPAFPMDSARILRSLLTMILRDDYAAGRATAFVASLMAPAMMMFGMMGGNIVMAMLGMFLMMNNTADMARRPGTELVPPQENK